MNFHGDIEKVSFEERLQPLFEAMRNGQTIASITCYAGDINKDDRSKDFVMENFVADDYWQRHGYVTSNVEGGRSSFYMDWVLAFVL